MLTKSEIRRYITDIKKSMTYEQITSLSETITDRLIKTKEYMDNENILVYVSYNQEVRTDRLIKLCVAQEKKVYVPKVFKNDNAKYMEFVRIHGYEDLSPGYKGIMEPVSNDYETLREGLIVMPGVAFDIQMNRIGYGGGFYDRYLQQHASGFDKIAICFDYQIVEHIEAERFDIKPDKIITDKRIIQA